MTSFDKVSPPSHRTRAGKVLQIACITTATAFVIVLLGGCSVLSELNLFAPSPTASLSENETPAPSATLTPAAQITTATLASDANHLILWIPPDFDPQSGTAAGDLLKNRLNEFITSHPGLTIDVRVKAATGAGGLLDSLSTTSAAAPAAIPSLVALPRSEMETAALKGLVYPWDDLIQPGNNPDSYPYAASLGKVQGTTYGLPFSGDALVMVFRPLQAGYAPTSWNEYTARKYPVIFPAGDAQALIPIQMLLSLAPADQKPPEQPRVNQEYLKKSYFVINEGSKSGTFPYWLSDYDTFEKGYQAFLDNRANYAVVWASSVIHQLPENVSLAALPAINAAPFTLGDGWMWVLTNSSEEKRQITVALAEFLVDPEFLAQWTEAANLLPTSQTILKQWKDQTGVATINEVAASARIIPANEFSSAVGPILQQGTLGIIRGQINYLQALENSLKDLELVAPAPGE